MVFMQGIVKTEGGKEIGVRDSRSASEESSEA